MSKHDEQYINKFQNSKFKVWVHIEEINEDEGYYQDVGEPISIGEFKNLDYAVDLVEAVQYDIRYGEAWCWGRPTRAQ